MDGDPNFVIAPRQTLKLLPTFLESTTSSRQFSAMEAACGSISLEALVQMTHRMKCVVISVESDACPSLVRAKYHIGEICAKHNLTAVAKGHGTIVFIEVRCLGHFLHNLMERAFRHTQIVPRLYDVCWCCRTPSIYSCIFEALEAIVKEDLTNGGFFPHLAPPAPVAGRQGHTVDLVRLIVKGQRFDTKARHEDLMLPTDEEELMRELSTMCNGDWGQRRLQHYCMGADCCEGQNLGVAISRMTAVLVRAFFGHMATDVPSTARWYTIHPQCVRQAGGMACHDILGRVFRRALKFETLPENDLASFHAISNQRKQSCLTFVEDQPRTMQTLLVASITGVPPTALSSRLQHLDDTGSTMVELTQPNGALSRCQSALWDASNPWCDYQPNEMGRYVDACSHLLRDRGGTHSAFLEELRNAALGLSASVWLLQVRYSNWPWRLLSGHHMTDPIKKELVFEPFERENACCLDEWFSTPLRAAFPSARMYAHDPQVKQLLVTLARRLKSTNMLLEGLISEVKASAPHGDRAGSVRAERLALVGCLRLFMNDFLRRGGADHRGAIGQKEMEKAGVPIEHRSKASTRNSRPDTAWRNWKLHEWRPDWPTTDAGSRAAKVKELSDTWNAMSEAERGPWLAASLGGDESGAGSGDQDDMDVDLAAMDPAGLFNHGLFNQGCDDQWPVSEDVLAAFFDDKSEARCFPGVARKIDALRCARVLRRRSLPAPPSRSPSALPFHLSIALSRLPPPVASPLPPSAPLEGKEAGRKEAPWHHER